MAKKGMEILLVRKSGPVQTMTFRAWWVYFLFMVLTLMLAGLGAGSYLLFKQHQALQSLADDTRLIMLRTERLESLVQEQETNAVIALQAARQEAAANKKKEALPEKPDKPQKPKAGLSHKKAPDKQAPPAPAAPPSAPPKTTESEKTPDEDMPAKEPESKVPVPNAAETAPNPPAAESDIKDAVPIKSDVVAIRNVKQDFSENNLEVTFDVSNASEGSDPAMGYVTLVASGRKGENNWEESWPPMRLSPAGRPQNYRRGTPFSVQRFRRVTAVFNLNGKVISELTFMVYSRSGELLLVHVEKAQQPPAAVATGSNS